MHIQNVDVIGLQATQAGINLAHHPGARKLAFIDPLAHFVAQFGGQHPIVTLTQQQLADHGFGGAAGVDVCRVDVVDAVAMRIRNDGGGFFQAGLVAKHHGSQAKG